MSANFVTNGKTGKSAPLVATDMLVYLTLIALVWGTWHLSRLEMFSPGDDLGYWIGVTGSLMMVLLFTYPMRKYFRFTRNWGKTKWWLWAHMVLGIGGPTLILLHSNFRVGSLNAGVALYSMLIVAASGVVGRFIYARVNRGLRGEQSDLRALQAKAGLDQQEVRSRLAFAPTVEALLKSFDENEAKAQPGLLTHLRRVFWLPIKQWLVYRECKAALREPIRKLAAHGKWSAEDLRRREATAQKMIWRYTQAVVRVAQFTAYERLFSLWHVAHIPFVYMLIASAIVHVVAVHAY